MFLSKDRVKEIIQKAPTGTSPSGIIAGLREKGYQMEGYVLPDGSVQGGPSDSIVQPKNSQTQGRGGGIMNKISSAIMSLFVPPQTLLTGGDLAIGTLKSVGQSVVGVSQMGQKIGHAIGIKGPGQDIPIQTPEWLKASNVTQQIGKTIGDVAQFFIPGTGEEKAMASLDKLVDAVKFSERFGPEAGNALSGILKVINHGIVTGASTAAVTAAQSGGDVDKIVEAGEIGFLAGATGKVFENVAPGLTKAIAKSNLRLTAGQETKLATQADKASTFISKNKIWGTPTSQFNKVEKITDSFEDVVQQTFKEGTADKQTLLGYLNEIPKRFEDDPAKYQKVLNDVESAKDIINQTKGDQIPLMEILKGKRSYAGSAYDRTGNLLLKDSKFAIQDAYYKTLEDHMAIQFGSGENVVFLPEGVRKYFGGKSEVPLREFMSEYSSAVNASKFLDIAKNKSDVGFVGKAITALATALAMKGLGPAGEMIGGYAGAEAASRGGTLVKSGFGRAAASGETTIPFAAKTYLGTQSRPGESPPGNQ